MESLTSTRRRSSQPPKTPTRGRGATPTMMEKHTASRTTSIEVRAPLDDPGKDVSESTVSRTNVPPRGALLGETDAMGDYWLNPRGDPVGEDGEHHEQQGEGDSRPQKPSWEPSRREQQSYRAGHPAPLSGSRPRTSERHHPPQRLGDRHEDLTPAQYLTLGRPSVDEVVRRLITTTARRKTVIMPWTAM